MTDHLTENARLRAAIERIGELNMLPPDENGHRWWSSDLIGQEVDAALATPAPDAVSDMGNPMSIREAARVMLTAPYSDVQAAFHAIDKARDDDEGPEKTFAAALRAIAGGQP